MGCLLTAGVRENDAVAKEEVYGLGDLVAEADKLWKPRMLAQLVADRMCLILCIRGPNSFCWFISATKAEDWLLASAYLVSSTWFNQMGPLQRRSY